MNRRVREIASVVFVAAVAVGGFFQPLIGLAVAVLLLAAAAMNFFRPRSFCSSVCPRGTALGFVLSRSPRRRPLPDFLKTGGVRKALCGFMMLCVVVNVVRSAGSFPALGLFFWGLCVLSLGAGLLLGFLYKPRAWCAVCPMGTLQDTLRGK